MEDKYYINIAKIGKALLAQTDDAQATALKLCECFCYITETQTQDTLAESAVITSVFLYYSVLSKNTSIDVFLEKVKNNYLELNKQLEKRGLI